MTLPGEIAHAAFHPLLEFQAMTQQTESGLHKLIAIVRTTMAQLQQIDLKTVSTSDVLYLHLIMGGLDSKTISEFTRTLTTSDVPALETCIDFLEKRAKDVALVREIKHNAGSSAHKAQNGNGNGNRNESRGKTPTVNGYHGNQASRQTQHPVTSPTILVIDLKTVLNMDPWTKLRKRKQ
ncbi:unnamed protein product [Orchesella dallaii]|uniref:Uncharacterized protein n=1 Tax=Orchesella dallaii TaxID=48710 RepID=A0ABP1RGK3_9HEXA